ncbi:MAG: hypothetical protein AAGJ82_02710, partial [Bacteroidota bacterium]
PTTLVASRFDFQPLDNFYFPYDEQLTDINDFRLPSYHRLDINARWTWTKPRGQHTLRLGIYNAYDRANAYFAYEFEDELEPENSGLRYQNGLPLLPMFGYGFRW